MAISRLVQTTLQNGFEKYNSIWDQRSAVGSMEAISSITLSAAQSSVEFNNIPGTYSHLQIRFIARSARTGFSDDNLALQLNANTGNNYAWHQLSGNGTAASSSADTSISSIRCGRVSAANATASIFGCGVIDILDYANTNKYRTIRTLTGYDENGAGLITLFSGLYQSTTAVTSIQIFSQTGANNISQNSSFSLYGIK